VIGCAEATRDIALYIDHELKGQEALEMEAHLTGCASCRLVYQDSRAAIDAVRAASPFYEVPDQCYVKIRKLVESGERGPLHRRWMPLSAVAALVVGIVIGMWFSFSLSKKNSIPFEYASFAAEEHLLYAKGAFPLDIVSSEPQVVSDWLSGRVRFHVRLPEYPSSNWQQKRYTLVGARLVQYFDEDVAYLAYEMDRKPISVLIASSPHLAPAGGETYRSGDLTFHFAEEKGLRMITWTDRGLTYAQVSTVDLPGAASCGVCHGSSQDRPKLDNLRPWR
jgi:anti-sigma factor RsiW